MPGNPSFGRVTVEAAASASTDAVRLSEMQAALNAKLDDTQASAFGLSLLDDTSDVVARATLGLGTAATRPATDFAPAGAVGTAQGGGGMIYVALTGTDTNDGLSWASARRSVKAAVAALPVRTSGTESFRAGTVHIGPGVFVEQGNIEANREIRFVGANARSDNEGTRVELANGRNCPLFTYDPAFATADGYSHGLIFDHLTLSANVAGQASTTLAAAATAAATTLTVTSAAAFPQTGTFDVLIGDEIVAVTAGAGTATWTITRALYGGIAAAHAAGATVRYAGSCLVMRGGGFNCGMRNVHLRDAGGPALRLDANCVNFVVFDFNASMCGGPALAYMPLGNSSGGMMSIYNAQIDDCGMDALYFDGAQSGSCTVVLHAIKAESRVSTTKHRHVLAYKPTRATNDASGFLFVICGMTAFGLGGGREAVVYCYDGINQGAAFELFQISGKDGYLKAFTSAKYGVTSPLAVTPHLSTGNFDTTLGHRGAIQIGNSQIISTQFAPEGGIVAVPGSLCLLETTGTLWIKKTGVGNTGWVLLG